LYVTSEPGGALRVQHKPSRREEWLVPFLVRQPVRPPVVPPAGAGAKRFGVSADTVLKALRTARVDIRPRRGGPEGTGRRP
jgi:hypothetical protein